MLFSTRIIAPLLMACTMPFITASKVLTQTTPSSTKLPSTGLRTTDQVLNQVCNFLKAQKSFTVEMDITYDNVLDSGEKVQYAAYQKVWVAKPNQLRSDYRGDQRNNSFYYDGKSLTLQNTDLDFYATKPAASTIDQVVNNVELKYGLTIPMSNLFVDDPCGKVTSDIQKSVFVGSNLVDRIPAHHILFIGEDRDWQNTLQNRPGERTERQGNRQTTRQDRQQGRTDRTDIRQRERTERTDIRQREQTDRQRNRQDFIDDNYRGRWYGGGWYGGGYRVPPAWGWAGFATGLVIGAAITTPPPYYSTVYVGSTTYIYSDGIFLETSGSSYIVVRPPIGAVVTYLPEGCSMIQINNLNYYDCSDIYYQPLYRNGSVVYKVVDF